MLQHLLQTGGTKVKKPALQMAGAYNSLRTLEMGDTSSDSTRMRGLYTFCFAKPGSITYTMPSMVSDVSAMLVDTCDSRHAH